PRGVSGPKFLLKNHPQVEEPLLRLIPHVGVTKMDFSRSHRFGYEGQMFLGELGDLQPITGNQKHPVGHQVVRIDPRTLEMETFFQARPDRLGKPPLEYVTTPGPKRPVDVRFSPEGDALYVADLGAVVVYPTMTPTPHPFAGSGVIWRIRRENAEPKFPIGLSLGPRQYRPAGQEMLTPTG